MISKKVIQKYIYVMLVVVVVMMVLFGCGENTTTAVEQEPEAVIMSEESTDDVIASDENPDENSSSEESSAEDLDATTAVTEEDSETIVMGEESTEADITEPLVALQTVLDGDSSMLDEELGRKLYQCHTSQANAVDFTGEWMRTNVVRAFEAKLTISNQDAEGFDVEGYVFWYSHSGVLEDGHAYFVTENVAVYEFYNDVLETYAYLLFYMDQDVMQIYATGADAAFLLGANCFWQGEYVKGEPSYTNETVVQDNFSEETLAQIHELIGDERYESMFITTLEYGTFMRENCVLANGTKATYYHSWIYGIATYNIFTLLIDENGEIYIRIGPESEFFSTVEGITELPEYEIE